MGREIIFQLAHAIWTIHSVWWNAYWWISLSSKWLLFWWSSAFRLGKIQTLYNLKKFLHNAKGLGTRVAPKCFAALVGSGFPWKFALYTIHFSNSLAYLLPPYATRSYAVYWLRLSLITFGCFRSLQQEGIMKIALFVGFVFFCLILAKGKWDYEK